ncbi:MAG TPA: hypothetical protein DEP84_35040 [Chloroflexi bacterium]|nr:hypothetical protein [Chloroflexota bacterium]
MKSSISTRAGEAFVAAMTGKMRAMAERLVAMVTTGEQGLEELEAVALPSATSLGNERLRGLWALRGPRSPAAEVACGRGAVAQDRERRTVQTKTIVDTIEGRRAASHCQRCHHGVAPRDGEMGRCAGGMSTGLEELVAVLGVTPDAFAQATTVLATLRLVSVCPNSACAATAKLGALVVAAEASQLAAAWAAEPHRPPRPTRKPERLSIAMDGVLVNVRREGWKAIKLGAWYPTTPRPGKQRPEALAVQAQPLSCVADLCRDARPLALARSLSARRH